MPCLSKSRHPAACALVAALVLTPHAALADADNRGGCARNSPGIEDIIHHPALYSFRLENDMFNGTDNGYTNGASFSWVSANLQNYLNDPCLPSWARRFNQLFESAQPSPGTSRNMVITAGQLMFTPSNRYRTDVIANDRPYAGWLYLGLGYNARNDQRMDSVEINLGVVGPASLGQQSQDFIHDLRGIPRFYGWNNQLGNEFGMQVVAERKKRVWEQKLGNDGFDAIVHYGASLGNVKTYLNTGFTLRVGRLPNDFGTSPIRPGADSNAPLEDNLTHHFSGGGLHGFVTTDARLVARDIFLDGNTFATSHRVQKEPMVGDLAAGIAWQWPGGKLAYAHYIRSKEFTTQTTNHGYGSITLSIEY